MSMTPAQSRRGRSRHEPAQAYCDDLNAGPLAPGAVIRFLGMVLHVMEVGSRPHSDGYGDVDFTAWAEGAEVSQCMIVNTPWGYAEIVRKRENEHITGVSSQHPPALVSPYSS